MSKEPSGGVWTRGGEGVGAGGGGGDGSGIGERLVKRPRLSRGGGPTAGPVVGVVVGGTSSGSELSKVPGIL